MKVVNFFITHKNNLSDSEGRELFTLESFDISKDGWVKMLEGIFRNNIEEVSEIVKFVKSDKDILQSNKCFEINEVYIFVHCAFTW